MKTGIISVTVNLPSILPGTQMFHKYLWIEQIGIGIRTRLRLYIFIYYNYNTQMILISLWLTCYSHLNEVLK